MVSCSCGKKLPSSQRLFVHQQATGHCFCKVCLRQFDDEASLTIHKNAVHQGSSSGSKEPETPLPRLAEAKKKKSWTCPRCDKSFASQGGANEHCSISHKYKCGGCSKTFISLRSLHGHNRLAGHCFCRQCDEFFPDASAVVEHRKTFIHAAGFHCCDCDRDFKTQQALDQHLEFKNHTSIKRVHECKECPEDRRREFKDQAALKKHQASVVHKPLSDLKCVASAKCKQRFSSPSALLHHLESGNCQSGLTRKALNELVQTYDTDRLISSGPAELDATEEVQNRLKSLTLKIPAFYTPISSDDSSPMDTPDTEDDSGVPLFPYLDHRSPALRPTDASAIQIQTRSGPARSGLFCPLCPERPKPFSTLAGLEMHLASSKHAPKVFHCPSSLFPPGTGKGKKSHGGSSVQHFSSLSGLAQHLESRACRGGQATFEKIVELLEDRLADLGFEQVRLLK